MKTRWSGWLVGFGLLLSSSTDNPVSAAILIVGTSRNQQPTTKRSLATDPLTRRISLPALQAPLGMVLREVARRGGVALSYSPTRLPLDVEVRVPAVHQQPLDEVLAAILQDQPVRYGVLAGQVVLWRRDERPPAAVVVGRRPGRAVSVARPTATVAAAAATDPAKPRPSARRVTSAQPDGLAGAAASRRLSSVRAGTAATSPSRVSQGAVPSVVSPATGMGIAVLAADSVQRPSAVAATTDLPSDSTRAVRYGIARSVSKTLAADLTATATLAAQRVSVAAARTARQMGNGVGLLSARIVGLVAPGPDSAVQRLPTRVAVAPASARLWRQRGVQVSLIPPLSTNGFANGRTVNKISLNLLIGYAAGVRGVEVGGLMNFARDSVVGLQVAGFANGVGGRVLGAQVAGVLNIASGGLEGVQSAGLINISRGPSAGWQSAGVLNIAHSHSGVVPGQPSPDRATEPLVQFAGLLNSAPMGIRGGQVAGLLNIAGRVKGVQIAGLLNVADTVAGVSLAPLNFVRRGYHALELSTDGVWPFALTLKLGGSAAFYTYFTGVTDDGFANPTRWGIGYGVGSELASRQRLSFSIDGQAIQFKENGLGWSMWNDGLNMHAQLRPQVGWGFGKKRRLRLVAGPLLNVYITEHLNQTTGLADTNLDTSGITIFSEAGKANTHTSGWISAAAGLRWRF
jgi:hypothetical protein